MSEKKYFSTEDFNVYKELLSLEIPLSMLIGEIQFYKKRVLLSQKKDKNFPHEVKREARRIVDSIEFSIETLREIQKCVQKIFSIPQKKNLN